MSSRENATSLLAAHDRHVSQIESQTYTPATAAATTSVASAASQSASALPAASVTNPLTALRAAFAATMARTEGTIGDSASLILGSSSSSVALAAAGVAANSSTTRVADDFTLRRAPHLQAPNAVPNFAAPRAPSHRVQLSTNQSAVVVGPSTRSRGAAIAQQVHRRMIDPPGQPQGQGPREPGRVAANMLTSPWSRGNIDLVAASPLSRIGALLSRRPITMERAVAPLPSSEGPPFALSAEVFFAQASGIIAVAASPWLLKSISVPAGQVVVVERQLTQTTTTTRTTTTTHTSGEFL